MSSEGTMRTAAQWQEIIPDGGPVQQAMVAAILADLAEYEKKWDILARRQNVLQDELATLEERFRKMAEQDRGDLQMLSDQLAAAESRIAALVNLLVGLKVSGNLDEQAITEIDAALAGDRDGWISVKERLPECGLIKGENEGWQVYRPRASRKIDCCFIHPSYWTSDDGLSQEITHWRPLPPPPGDDK